MGFTKWMSLSLMKKKMSILMNKCAANFAVKRFGLGKDLTV